MSEVDTVDMTEVKKAIDDTGRAFEEFKKTNDERLAELDKKGSVDPLVEEKLANIEKDLDQFEGLNQKITLASKNQENIQEKLNDIETYMKRPESGFSTKRIDQNLEIFGKWLRKGKEGMDKEEVKALTVGDDTQAGFLAPPEYVRELIKTLTEISPVRSIARVRSTTLRAVQMPSRTATFTAAWVAEQGTRSETTGYTTNLEEIPTHELYALVDISEQELEDSVFDLEAEMSTEFAEQFAKAEGLAFTTGDKVGKPEGFTTNVGSSTTGGSGAVTADTLLTLVHSIKTPYGQNATFAFNRTTLGAIRKLKDGEGQYVFQQGMLLTNGVPNTILGYPYVEMPDMADVASSAICVVFGDFRAGYMIVDRVALSILRDPYTQATSGNVRYIARRRVGGQVVLTEALAKYVPS
jgi:HK97 family phage major capsid protein